MLATPSPREMYQALLDRDASFEGIFVVGVKSTGIFCRPTCPARKPKWENVEFFASTRGALLAGYRACKRCRPLEPAGAAPSWLPPLLVDLEKDPSARLQDRDLRARGLEPTRVRRWFLEHHGMTFHAFGRARRLGSALGHIRDGEEVTRVALDSGYDSLSGFGEAFKNLFGEPPSRSKETTVLSVSRLLSPLGPLLAAATPDALCLLEFVDRRALETQIDTLRKRMGAVFVPKETPLLRTLKTQLDGYFAGKRATFDLPLAAPGTAFQEAVWRGLQKIPYGQTCSYQALARSLHKPKAFRAVARANGDNRIAILIPCHRVIAADGRLSGYGGQVWRKRALLDLERRTLIS